MASNCISNWEKKVIWSSWIKSSLKTQKKTYKINLSALLYSIIDSKFQLNVKNQEGGKLQKWIRQCNIILKSFYPSEIYFFYLAKSLILRFYNKKVEIWKEEGGGVKYKLQIVKIQVLD